jgi:DNA-binding NtrC family response regulator
LTNDSHRSEFGLTGNQELATMTKLDFTILDTPGAEGAKSSPAVFTLVIKNCPVSYPGAQRAFDTAFIGVSLHRFAGNVSRTARSLGISRRNLTRKIRDLQIDMEAMRSADMAMFDTSLPVTVNLSPPSGQ